MSFQWTKTEKRVNQIVVRQKPIGAKTLSVAQDVGNAAEGFLEAHRHKGHSRIEVEQGSGGVDAFVNLDDSRGEHAALSIEFGHTHHKSKKSVLGVAPLRKAVAQFV